MKRKDNVKYYWAQNQINSKESMIIADYSKLTPRAYEEIIATIRHKDVRVEYIEKHYPPCNKEVVQEIINNLK